MFVFFPAIHLSLNILQICFHISDILFLISLIKCHKSALSYFSILTLSSEVLGGNGPFVWVLPNHDAASWYKMLPIPVSSPPLFRHMHISFSSHQLACQVQQRSDSGKKLARNCAQSCRSHVENSCGHSSWGQASHEVVRRSRDGRDILPIMQVRSIAPDCQLFSM